LQPLIAPEKSEVLSRHLKTVISL